MFSADLIFTQVDIESQEQLFEFLYQQAYDKGLVYDNYKEKLMEREREFPTGIPLSTIGIAIPHADVQYAKDDAFIVITSKNGIPFRNMEDGEDMVANIVIGLIFNNKDNHIEHLQKLSSILQNEELLIKINKCQDSNEVYQLLTL